MGGHVVGGHVDGSPAGALQRGRVPARGPGGLPHQVELGGPFGLGEATAGKVAVTAQARAAGGGRAGAPDVDGQPAQRLGEAAQAGEGEELAVEADSVLVPVPEQPQHVDGLVRAAAAGGEVDAARHGLAGQRAHAHREQAHPALGQHVEGGQPLGQGQASRLARTTG